MSRERTAEDALRILEKEMVTSENNRLTRFPSPERTPERHQAWVKYTQNIINRNLYHKYNVTNGVCLRAAVDSVLGRTPSRYLVDFHEIQFEKNKNLVNRTYFKKAYQGAMSHIRKIYPFIIWTPKIPLVDTKNRIFTVYRCRRARREKILQSLLPLIDSEEDIEHLDVEGVEQIEIEHELRRNNDSMINYQASGMVGERSGNILGDLSEIDPYQVQTSTQSIFEDSNIPAAKTSQGKMSLNLAMPNNRLMDQIIDNYHLGPDEPESKDITLKMPKMKIPSFNDATQQQRTLGNSTSLKNDSKNGGCFNTPGSRTNLKGGSFCQRSSTIHDIKKFTGFVRRASQWDRFNNPPTKRQNFSKKTRLEDKKTTEKNYYLMNDSRHKSKAVPRNDTTMPHLDYRADPVLQDSAAKKESMVTAPTTKKSDIIMQRRNPLMYRSYPERRSVGNIKPQTKTQAQIITPSKPILFIDFISKAPSQRESHEPVAKGIFSQRNSSLNHYNYNYNSSSFRGFKGGPQTSTAGPKARPLMDLIKNTHTNSVRDERVITLFGRPSAIVKNSSGILDLKGRALAHPAAKTLKVPRNKTAGPKRPFPKIPSTKNFKMLSYLDKQCQPVLELPLAEEVGNSQTKRELRKMKSVHRFSAKLPECPFRTEFVDSSRKADPLRTQGMLLTEVDETEPAPKHCNERIDKILGWKRDYGAKIDALPDRNNIYKDIAHGVKPPSTVYERSAMTQTSKTPRIESIKRRLWAPTTTTHPSETQEERMSSVGKGHTVNDLKSLSSSNFVSFKKQGTNESVAKTQGHAPTHSLRTPIADFMLRMSQKQRKPAKN